MAKAKTTVGKRSAARQRKWPASADLKPWLECYLDVCEQHPQADEAGIKAGTPLKQLAECGHSTAALKRLQRMLDRLPASDCKAAAFLALIGAEICLDVPDVRRAEKFLQQVEALYAKAGPPDQQAIQTRFKQLRLANALPESAAAGAVNVESVLFGIGQLRQQYRTALLAGDTKAAAKALEKTTKLIPGIDQFWHAPGLTLSAINAFRRLGNETGLIKYVDWLDRNRHTKHLATGSLWGMGLCDVANRRAEKLVAGHLKRLKRDPDPNIHFPVDEICKELWFFVQTGQKDVAAKLLKKVLRELPDWPGVRAGFATSGVLTDLAEVLAEIDGPEAACKLLGLAVQAGEVEPQRGFRKGALKAAKKQIEAPGLAAAIAKAESIKNAKERREALIPLLTKGAAWPELGTLLNEITSADELMESLHTVLFKLSGGARLV